MTSLEIILNRKVIIPAILSTADDMSAAFHIAVNGPEIDWPFAEALLEKFSFLWNDDLILRDILTTLETWKLKKQFGRIMILIAIWSGH